MSCYTAIVTPDGAGWMIRVPEVDRVSYSPTRDGVMAMAHDLLVVMTGDDSITADDITITWPTQA